MDRKTTRTFNLTGDEVAEALRNYVGQRSSDDHVPDDAAVSVSDFNSQDERGSDFVAAAVVYTE